MKSEPAKSAPASRGPLKVDFPFDDAISLAIKVKPPEGGWAAYEAELKAQNAEARRLKNEA